MATAIFRGRGEAIDYTPGSAVAAGDVVVQGDLVAIAELDIAANTLGALHTEGMFDVAKIAGVGTAITVGTKLYYDVAEKVAKADDEAGANKYIGKCVKAAADADTTVRLKLGQD